jgi:ADP-ribose pyrophosphatase
MAPQNSAVEASGPLLTILDESEEYRYNEQFRVVKARFRFRRSDGQMSEPVTRISFERGDSVGVLLYDREEDTVLLVRQFRYPAYSSLDAQERSGAGAAKAWLVEIVAGVHEAGHGVREVAHKELMEEAGYRVRGELEPIASIYPSPGGSSERIHLYLGYVDRDSRVGAGGGIAGEGEDTRVVVLPLREAIDQVANGQIRDAKTIIALQHLALCKLSSP